MNEKIKHLLIFVDLCCCEASVLFDGAVFVASSSSRKTDDK